MKSNESTDAVEDGLKEELKRYALNEVERVEIVVEGDVSN